MISGNTAHRLTSSALNVLVRPLRDFLFPPVCFSCGTALVSDSGRICSACHAAIKLVDPEDGTFRETFSRLSEGGAVSLLVAPWYFEKDGPLQSLIHDLKYRGMTGIGEELGEEVGRLFAATGTPAVDGLVPIPLHTSKLRERGYNQSESIARGIARATGWQVFPRVLERYRFTVSQTTLSRDDRLVNVRDAFVVPPSRRLSLSGKTVMLVDDVITTGATMNSCAAVLRAADARSVLACAIALAPSPN